MKDLSVNIGGVAMANPVALASGTCGYGEVYDDFYKPVELGAVVTKGISILPRKGNPTPRMAETPAGMLNSIGLENVGLEVFLKEKMPWLRAKMATTVVNFFGETVEEYVKLAEALSEVGGIAGLEMNISCPNVGQGGLEFGTDPQRTSELVSAVRKATDLPLWVKLSPNVTDITVIAKAAVDAGADALSLINTLRGMVIDIQTGKPLLGNLFGGLSGPAIRPVAVAMVYQVARAVDVPVVGIGGIMNEQDAMQFFAAGAKAVQIGTACFIDPHTPVKIIKHLSSIG